MEDGWSSVCFFSLCVRFCVGVRLFLLPGFSLTRLVFSRLVTRERGMERKDVDFLLLALREVVSMARSISIFEIGKAVL